jgi:hypothetical protein
MQIASSEPHAVSRQKLLEKAADRLLRNDKFYPKRDKNNYPVDADCISSSGHLKPIAGRP